VAHYEAKLNEKEVLLLAHSKCTGWSGRRAQDSETEPDLLGRIIANERLVKYALWNLIVWRVDEAAGGDAEKIRKCDGSERT
jgi:hypothetical protein